MKKNVMMRLASGLLVAVLLTTCAISGTFAKYVTTQSGSDSARVAKWGVGVVVNGETFANAYADKAAGNMAASAGTVLSSEDVVAPGTKGNLGGVTLSGTPEVAVAVTYKADLNLTGWEVVGVNKYCPIVITVKQGSNTQTFQIALGTDAADLENAVETYINTTCSAVTYPAGTNLAAGGVTDNMLQVSWEWPFEVNDVADTALGDQAANGNAAKIEFTLECTVTQID